MATQPILRASILATFLELGFCFVFFIGYVRSLESTVQSRSERKTTLPGRVTIKETIFELGENAPVFAYSSSLPSQNGWSKNVVLVKNEVDSTLIDLETAGEIAKHIPACKTNLNFADNELQMVARSLNQLLPQFQTVISRLQWAKSYVIDCQNAMSKQPKTAYQGQAEIASALSSLDSAQKHLSTMEAQYTKQNLLSGNPLTTHSTSSSGALSSGNNFFLMFNGVSQQGSRVRSQMQYKSGIFSARIKCPSEGSGLDTAFFLASDADYGGRSSIILEFNGQNRSLAALSTIVKGVTSNSVIVALGYDCADDFHTYSITWSANQIIWRNEKSLLGLVNLKYWKGPFPRGPMYLYMELALLNTVGINSWTTGVHNWGANWVSSIVDVVVTSPITKADIPAVENLPPHSPWFPFCVDYCLNSMEIGQNAVSVSFNSSGCGGRLKTSMNFRHGQFSAQIKCPSGDTSGLVTAFYLSTMEGSPTRDEIDFEFLGNTKSKVQTNLFVRGVGNREKLIDLGYDCSHDYHTYTLRYTRESILWFIDGIKVREIPARNGRPYPSSPLFIYVSLWNATAILNGRWAGNYSGSNSPYTAHFKNFQIDSP